jgi:hypothetical protein
MTLDNERQRDFLMMMFSHLNFSGSARKEAYELKRAIALASLGHLPPVPRPPGLLSPGQSD